MIKLKKLITEKIYDSDLRGSDLNELKKVIKKIIDKLPIYSEKEVEEFIIKKASKIIKEHMPHRNL